MKKKTDTLWTSRVHFKRELVGDIRKEITDPQHASKWASLADLVSRSATNARIGRAKVVWQDGKKGLNFVAGTAHIFVGFDSNGTVIDADFDQQARNMRTADIQSLWTVLVNTRDRLSIRRAA